MLKQVTSSLKKTLWFLQCVKEKQLKTFFVKNIHLFFIYFFDTLTSPNMYHLSEALMKQEPHVPPYPHLQQAREGVRGVVDGGWRVGGTGGAGGGGG